MEHRFEYLTSEELKPHIEQKSLLIMGIGTIEEHGQHLPTGTDWFITQRFTDDVAAYLKANSSVPFSLAELSQICLSSKTGEDQARP